jgi:hypothetical protein
MKGLLFGGCSFTWGQGLYFYSDLPDLFYPKPYEYHSNKVTDAHLKFKDTLRFPRLVANHFNTFETFKTFNGGSEDETFSFFENIFTDKERKRMMSHLSLERYDYNDFDYIIIQLSQLFRNRFYFEIDGHECFTNVSPNANYGDYQLLLKWMEINNKTYDDWQKELSQAQYLRLLKELKFYEDKGIKTKILTWENDLVSYIKNDQFLNERFIKLSYKNKTYDTIQQMQNDNKELYIEYDYDFFGENPPKDHHPSKLCHRVIADNIIKSIENDIK